MSLGRILLLEDDVALREQLAELLEEYGYTVGTAGGGAQAVELAQSESFDLIVTDIRMEGMSGLDALEQVKADTPDIGSLVITGYSTEADSIRALQLGAGDYLKKPFHTRDFLHAVEAQMARRRKEQRTVKRERAWRQTAVWSLETVSRSLDLDQGPGALGGLVEGGRLAARVAVAMGLGMAQAEETQLGFLHAALQRAREVALPPFLADGLPETVMRLVEEVTQPEQVSLPARIVSQLLAQDARRDGEPPADGEVGQALVRLQDGPEQEHDLAAALEQARRRRSLLSLGRALGNGPDAESALQSVLGHEPPNTPTREGVEAQLAMARLRMASSQMPEAAALCLEAAQRARGLLPTPRGLAQLDAALLLLQMGHREGAACLTEAESVLSGLGAHPEAARARLAQRRLQGPADLRELAEDLRLLLLPDHLDCLYHSAGWLLPWLCEAPGALDDPVAGRVLLALAHECPNAFAAVLSPKVSEQARRNAVESLAACGTAPARELLARLQGDLDEAVRKRASEALLQEEAVSPPVLRIYSFGPFTVYLGEHHVKEWHSQKVRYLLACLAANPGRPTSEDMLVEAFWPEDPVRGKNNLYTTTSNLRRALRPPGFKGDLNIIPRTPAGLTLNPDVPRWHDLEELENALKEAQSAGADRVAALIRAARLYKGEYLEGCYYDWALLTRNRIEVRMQEALGQLIRLLSERNRWTEVLEFSQQLLELEPCSQEAHLALMKAHLALGHPEQVLRQFEACRVTLHKELQLEPSSAILEMRQRALLSVG